MLQTYDIMLAIFLKVADTLKTIDYKHPQGKLWLSEIITIGILWVLSGKPFRRFYRWLKRERYLPNIPERTRLGKLIAKYQKKCDKFLDNPTLFEALDSFGVEIIHPIREGRSKESQRVSKKGKSNHRWIIGRKISISFNGNLRITKYADETVNVSDNVFDDLYADNVSIRLTDNGFRKRNGGTPDNFKICTRGTWGERMAVETLFSLWTRVCNMKKSFHRTIEGFKAKVSYLVALTNTLFDLNQKFHFNEFSMVQWAI